MSEKETSVFERLHAITNASSGESVFLRFTRKIAAILTSSHNNPLIYAQCNLKQKVNVRYLFGLGMASLYLPENGTL